MQLLPISSFETQRELVLLVGEMPRDENPRGYGKVDMRALS